jgi:4-amino-4-deoxy-L-arabinose transferase-like glycosyltransferase
MILPARRFPLAVGTALGLGLVFRLWLVQSFPFEAGDTPLYELLAKNIVAHGIFGLEIDGNVVPVNVRMPGYPAFLAASHALFGPGYQPVRVAQAVLDTTTCVLAGFLAALLASPRARRRAFVAGVWLAAACPFTANYAAAILAETTGAFWTAGSLVLLLLGVRRTDAVGEADDRALAWHVGAGLLAGLGCLFRPETPLVLMAGGVVLLVRWRRPADWRRLFRTGLALAIGLALSIGPWAVRNALVLGRLQVLPPAAANLPGEVAPLGFNAWTDTWLTTVPQIYDFQFKIEDEPLPLDRLPPSAIDTPEEKERLARLFAEHNETFTLTPELDGGFAQLARERTARHPLRTWLTVPLARVPAMWISPRLDLLPFSGQVFPVREAWEDDPVDFSVTVALSVINVLYLLLAAAGAWRASWRPGAAILVAYVLLRTLLITRMPGPEPRYVVICFPLLAALGAQLWARARPAAPALPRDGTA